MRYKCHRHSGMFADTIVVNTHNGMDGMYCNRNQYIIALKRVLTIDYLSFTVRKYVLYCE